jgi:hypothetical protein
MLDIRFGSKTALHKQFSARYWRSDCFPVSGKFTLLHIGQRILDFVEALHGARNKAGGQT